jgi:tetratricopeptide (TPR) repeat protein
MQYCRILISTPFSELRNGSAAVAYAQKAVELTKSSDPAALDLLARSYELAGNVSAAIDAERKAIALLPAGAQSGLRRQLEENLAKLLSKAPAGNPPIAAK